MNAPRLSTTDMPADVTEIKSRDSSFPAALRSGNVAPKISRIWTIGNREILNQSLLSFFCSKKCPGDVILRTYDVARALRDAGVPVIGGFHSPMEKECLDLLLRGKQPVVVCPARGLDRMRIPRPWRDAISEDRLLVLSSFDGKILRATADQAEQRNRIVGALATHTFVAHAGPGSKTLRLVQELGKTGKRICTLNVEVNKHLSDEGVTQVNIEDLIKIGRKSNF